MGGGKKILTRKEFLLGNEAIARGALEANVGFVAGYPGTPSTEIIETLAQDAQRYGIHVEWSTNEMVAFENAVGASLAGLRAMVTMKHAGMNWIADPLSVVVLSGIRGGLVIVTADDPNCHSSANEQDNRFYGMFFKILTLEPSNPQEAKEMTKEAFVLSEKTELPVILRTVTRLSHVREPVVLEEILSREKKVNFERIPDRFYVTGARTLQRRRWQIKQQLVLEELSEKFAFNKVFAEGGEKICIIASGIAYNYVSDALRMLGVGDLSLLKLASVYPLPKSLIKDVLRGKETVFVVEEGEPFVELQLKAMASDLSLPIRFLGKGSGELPAVGELTVDTVGESLARILGKKEWPTISRDKILQEVNSILPVRSTVYCAGCPHTGTMYALKNVLKKRKENPIIAGDIGCYTMMNNPPHELGDIKYSMGASISVAAGISKAFQNKEKVISVIGDSTFLHAGIPGLMNCVYNGCNTLIVICDNHTTAQTGGQPHAATGRTVLNQPTAKIELEKIIRGCGVECLELTDAFNIRRSEEAISKALEYSGVSVLISSGECALESSRARARSGKPLPPYRVNQDSCIQCYQCLELLTCPALERVDDAVMVNNSLCVGCGICAQICSVEAIEKEGDSNGQR